MSALAEGRQGAKGDGRPDGPGRTGTPGSKVTLVLKGGCFWGLEYGLSAIPGIATAPGYAGGHRKGTKADGSPRDIKPTYYNLADSGDAEAVRVTVSTQGQLRAVVRELVAHLARDPSPSEKPRYARGAFCAEKAMAPHVAKALAEVGLTWRVGSGDDGFVEAEARHHGHYLRLYGPPDREGRDVPPG